jgi:8-oxo-dGTP diphosphatase
MARASRHPVGPDGRPRHALTADGVLFDGDRVLLVRRRNPPDRGRLALPGGFVDGHESLEDAVVREVLEETGLATAIVGLVGVYSAPGRDPRGPTCTGVYLLERTGGRLRAGDDASAASFVSLAKARREKLAFDHDQVLADAILFRAALGPALAGAPSRVSAAPRNRRTSPAAPPTAPRRRRPARP